MKEFYSKINFLVGDGVDLDYHLFHYFFAESLDEFDFNEHELSVFWIEEKFYPSSSYIFENLSKGFRTVEEIKKRHKISLETVVSYTKFRRGFTKWYSEEYFSRRAKSKDDFYTDDFVKAIVEKLKSLLDKYKE